MNNHIQKHYGFTLIELMIVIAIIGIMASLGLPSYLNWVTSAKVSNAVNLVEELQPSVKQFYIDQQRFPQTNQEAGIPPAEKLLSPEVTAINMIDGAFHITLSPSAHTAIRGKVITVRPVYVADSPKSPISWICGNAPVPKGMTAAGTNNTNVNYTFLPINCRDLSGKEPAQ